MSGNYLGNAGTFLISTVFGLYILLVLLRFLFQMVRADFYNPISQAVVKLTNPALRPLRRVIKGVAGIDVASVVLLLVLKVAELTLVAALQGVGMGFIGLFVLAVAALLQMTLHVFLFAVLIQVILSWVAPHSYNPASSLLLSLTEPLLRPARRLIPAIGGLDFSPVVVLVVLQLSSMLIIAPLRDLGATLAMA
ncbi:MAG: YggT family protein [Gammaproteobacteria bacterium]